VFIEAKDDGVGGNNWSHKMSKAPDRLSPPTNQHPTFYRPDANSIKALNGKYHIPWTCLPHAQLGVFQLCLWPL